MDVIKTIIEKLKNNEELTEKEISILVYEGNVIDEIEGYVGRWDQYIYTIIDVEGQLYKISWLRGLTELQGNTFLEQPYMVRKVEKVVTKTVVEYEREDN